MSRATRLLNQGRRAGYVPNPAMRQQEHDRHDAKRVPRPKRPKPEVIPATEERIAIVHRHVDPMIALRKFALGESSEFPKDLALCGHAENALRTGRGKRRLKHWAQSYSSSFQMIDEVLASDHEISVQDCENALFLSNSAKDTVVELVIPSALRTPELGLA